jgi:hypothetical protein
MPPAPCRDIQEIKNEQVLQLRRRHRQPRPRSSGAAPLQQVDQEALDDRRFANGTSKTYEGQNHHGFERRTAPVIPATPGFELISLRLQDDAEPSAANLSRQPIIAWRIEGTYVSLYPTPIGIDDDPGNEEDSVILRPDGVVVAPGYMRWENLDAWIAHECDEWRVRRAAKEKKQQEEVAS